MPVPCRILKLSLSISLGKEGTVQAELHWLQFNRDIHSVPSPLIRVLLYAIITTLFVLVFFIILLLATYVLDKLIDFISHISILFQISQECHVLLLAWNALFHLISYVSILGAGSWPVCEEAAAFLAHLDSNPRIHSGVYLLLKWMSELLANFFKKGINIRNASLAIKRRRKFYTML